ncbi:hypothetical protein PR202_ga00416 [Eleusine coracana subsp. coracana]|uniref:Uncharacterized protein n=1 Tax=Eleusine coracana subsp. coracana TaxID=191504 RepID=A0AAV5BCH6_ELECO|nr:hypothetical protein PR202_ga00416 [Eleusine coracana subsp. coracana]
MEADEASLPPPPWTQNKSAAAIEASSGPLAAAASRLAARSRALPSFRDFTSTTTSRLSNPPSAPLRPGRRTHSSSSAPRRSFQSSSRRSPGAAISTTHTTGFSVDGPQRQGCHPGTKAKVHFHISTIPRPQDVYHIVVDNSNKPFEHVLLERSEDGSRAIHPLEKLPVEQLIDRNTPNSEPVKPSALDDTPFTFVDDLKTLEVLAMKLKSATEFAVSSFTSTSSALSCFSILK